MKNSKEKEINIHKDHRSRVKQKFLTSGLNGFANHEVLEFLLYYSLPRIDTNGIAHELINKFGSISGVFEASVEALMEVKGISEHSAILIKLVPAIYNIISLDKVKSNLLLDSSFYAKMYITDLFKGLTEESFYIICLDSKNKVIGTLKFCSEEKNKVNVPIRQVTSFVLKRNCNRIVLAHNHPSGSSHPSLEDIALTRRLFNSCMLNDIDILDHLIYTEEDIYGFAEHGDMDAIKKSVVNDSGLQNPDLILRSFSSSVDPYKFVPKNKNLD